MNDNELMHYGVLGMKWGKRRYQNADGSLTDKGIKRYATKGYAKDSYDSNKTRAGKAFDLYTGAHKTEASIKYDTSSKKANKARAEQYLKDQQKSKNTPLNKKVGKAVGNQINKHVEKNQQRDEKLKKSVDRFGSASVSIGTAYKSMAKVSTKGMLAKTINASANAYISSRKGNYYTQQAVHYARRAAIAGLSVSAAADEIRAVSDIGKAYVYGRSKT